MNDMGFHLLKRSVARDELKVRPTRNCVFKGSGLFVQLSLTR